MDITRLFFNKLIKCHSKYLRTTLQQVKYDTFGKKVLLK